MLLAGGNGPTATPEPTVAVEEIVEAATESGLVDATTSAITARPDWYLWITENLGLLFLVLAVLFAVAYLYIKQR
jgi:hypothetical protein